MNENEQTPNDRWSLDRLGAFCVERDRRMAVDAWKTGMAMYLAKNRCKDEGESFTEWKKKHGFSNAKVSRYIRLYRAFPSEVDQKRLIEIGIMEALREAGIAEAKATSCGNTAEQEVVDDDSTAEATTGESESDHTERAAKELPRSITEQRRPLAKRANDHTAHSWAVETDDSDDELPDTEEYLVDMLSRGETLEECRKAVPWQTRILRQNVESVLGQDRETLRKAWSECETDRRQFADDLDALLRLLPDLSATLPDDGDAALALAG